MDNISTSFIELTSSIPGYGIFSRVLLQQFGIDIGQLVSIHLVIYALYQVGQYIYHWVSDLLLLHFTSHIEVDDWDPLYNRLLDWASAHRMTKFSRELKAVTFDSSTSNTFHDNEEKLKQTDGGDLPDTVSLFNFQKWHSKNPLIYKPNFNTRYFAHNGHLFHWSSGRRTGAYQGFDHFIVLRCFGRNAKPVKDLLHEIKDFTLTKEIKTTEVYRSSMNAEAGQWLRQSVKPSRPLCTVSLDEQQKAQITIDLNEYLQPSTARWYASRGIPYRRGYLFHGPPGTGKTSLGFALAGIFGLGIYCVSLSEMGLTESHLATLFGNLPQRCIVLLEDVDAAGLRRNNDGLLNPAGCEPPSPTQGPELVRVSIASIRAAQSKGGRSLISLAGLLNIIDGPAAQEGRVLIMTTNRPETLDTALVRPGRVDHQISFTLATHEQIRDMYSRMYSPDQDADHAETSPTAIMTPGQVQISTHEQPAICEDLPFDLYPYLPKALVAEPKKVADLAKQFADKLPENTFSPADIQGFLLKRRRDPEGALRDVETWRDEYIEQMRVAKKGFI